MMRRWSRLWVAPAVAIALLSPARGSGQVTFTTAPILTAGLGVLYFNPQDLVNAINGSGLVSARADAFKAFAEFYGNALVPLSRDWAVGANYAYVLGSYNLPALFAPAEFTCTIHAPSVLVVYCLWQERYYAIWAGIGGGYHFGSVHASVGTIDDTYKGSGPAFMLNLDGNTALGDRLYAYLGVFARWEGIGRLTDDAGNSFNGPQTEEAPTLSGFGLGAKLGVSYMF